MTTKTTRRHVEKKELPEAADHFAVTRTLPSVHQRGVSSSYNEETEMEVNLRRQACDLKAELGSISMVDEFAKYAKIKRKVNKVTDELTHQADLKSSYTMKVRIIASAALYALISSTVLFLLWNYRKVPVVVLPENWLYPVGFLLTYPSDVAGGISLTSWLFITGTVGRTLVAKF